jgi:hypothetical protein
MMPEDWFSICLIGRRPRGCSEQQRDAAAALGQLQGGVDAAGDRLHVVLDAQQEAADELAALRLAGVEEGRGRGLEAAGDDLVDELLGERWSPSARPSAVMTTRSSKRSR